MALLETPDGRLHLEALLTRALLIRKELAGGYPLRLLLAATLLLPVPAAAAVPPKPACALFRACALEGEIPDCTAEQSRPIGGIEYDAPRCAEPRDLLAHGVTPISEMGGRVYPFLGGRYRLVYAIKGEAPISVARFDYLADDLPLAAHLASRFSKTKYVMRYTDPVSRRFHASRAEKLAGEAELLFLDLGEKDKDGRRRTYFGWGSSKFGPWKLHGSAYVDVSVRPNGAGIAYDVRIRTAPANAMVNAIMRLGLFKGYVVGQIEDTMKDLVGAAAALSARNLEKVLTDPGFTEHEREKVRAFAALPD